MVEAAIQANGGVIYDHWDPTRRRQLDLNNLAEEYPVFDDGGMENRIYSEDGQYIKRVRVRVARGAPSAGVLVHLDTVGELFDNDDQVANDDGSDSEGEHRHHDPVSVSVYPQSYFQRIGHVKANGVISALRGVVARMNRELVEGNDDEYMEVPGRQALTPISCQLYNELSHRVAKRAGTQEVQRGDQTAAMAFHYPGYNATADRRGLNLVVRCTESLPSARHFALLNPIDPEENMPTDLRVENVYSLDMKALLPVNRTGR